MQFLHAVTANWDARAPRKIGGLEPASYAAAVRGVRLNEGKPGALEGVFELALCMKVFAHCQWATGGFGDSSISLIIIGFDRLFEPDNSQFHKSARRFDRLLDSHGVVRVHHEIESGPDQVPHGAGTI